MMPIGDHISCCATEKPGGAFYCHSNHSIHCFFYCYSAGKQEEGVVSINNKRKRVILVTPVTVVGPSSRSFGACQNIESDLRARDASRLFTPVARRPTEADAPFHTFLANIALALQEVIGSKGIAYGFTNLLKLKRIAVGQMDNKSIVHHQTESYGFSGRSTQIRNCDSLSTLSPGKVRARP